MTETSVAQDDRTTALRRDLMKVSTMWHRRFEAAMVDGAPNPGDCMAGSYAYTLAAVLKAAETGFGPEVAQSLAEVAAEVLENGDFEDWNADVS